MNSENNITSLESQLAQINNEIIELKTHLESKQKSNERLLKLNTFTGLSPIERLKKIISDSKPVFYFPEYFFNYTLDVLDKLDESERAKLKAKLKTAGRGILKQLKNEIYENAKNNASD